ncbi:MAG: class I SAM-dependent methyltransferase [Symploca sp. SIO2G7]|nr:class I SAM-dependent methyltransferase [Symploca sp. SIO2G7]
MPVACCLLPVNATVAFAEMGFSLLCLEPNRDFYWLARQNCQQYPNVEILNTSFEEWSGEAEAFDAIIAATAMHWVSPEIAYPKAANILKENGSLILLWNVIPEPSPSRYNSAREIYQTYAPAITAYEGKESQQAKLKGIEEVVINSGKFVELVSGWIDCQAVYSIDDYLALLSTLSPYLKLEQYNRELLFKHLRESMEQDIEKKINVSYLSAFQVAYKYIL